MVITSISRPIQSGGLICRLRNWISSRVILPPIPLRIAPLGDLVASLSSSASLIAGYFASNSSSCWRLTVMPAFLTPTPWVFKAAMAARTASPLVLRRFSAVRSISTRRISRRLVTNCSRIRSKATWAISSPWRMTRGFWTRILPFIRSPEMSWGPRGIPGRQLARTENVRRYSLSAYFESPTLVGRAGQVSRLIACPPPGLLQRYLVTP